MVEGKVMSWACEAHNCGPHQWAMLIDPASGATDACYYEQSVDAGRSHWFLAGGKEEWRDGNRSEEHTSELQSLMRISYAVFCLKKQNHKKKKNNKAQQHNKDI